MTAEYLKMCIVDIEICGEISQRKTNIVYFHSYVESKTYKRMNITNRLRYSKLVVNSEDQVESGRANTEIGD